MINQYLSDYHYQKSLSQQISEKERINHLQLAIQNNPDNALYYYQIGSIHLKQAGKSPNERSEKYSLVHLNFQNAIYLNPTNYVYHLHLASVNYKETKNVIELADVLKKVRKLNPSIKKVSKFIEKLKTFF